MAQLGSLLFVAPAILIAIICHECAHGWMSDRLGDPTPRASGRLTLNPLRHLDLWGTLCLLFFHVGWAKPVPINPYYYKDRKKGIILVSLAGPVMNFLVAFVSVLLEGLLVKYGSRGSVLITVLILLPEYSARTHTGLGVFNLIPVPPLDGSKVLGELAPSVNQLYRRWGPYWQWGLLILLVVGVLSVPLSAIDSAVYNLMWDGAVRLLRLYAVGGGGAGVI